MTDRPLRVGLWCAVSSKPQAERVSLDDQEQAGRRFTERVGGEVVAVYVVPGHTRDFVFWHEAEDTMPAYRQIREDLAHRREALLALAEDFPTMIALAEPGEIASLLQQAGVVVLCEDGKVLHVGT